MIKYDRQRVADLLTYAKRVNDKRGELINESANLEAILDSLIVTHFCSEQKKQNELLPVIQKLVLEKKIDLLKIILKDNYKEFVNEYPDTIKHLTEIRIMRNYLAHRMLHTTLETASENLKNKTVALIEKDNKIKKIAEGKIQDAINMAKHYTTLFLLYGRSSAT